MHFKLFVILASPLAFSHTHSALTSIFCLPTNELWCWIWTFLIILYPLPSVVIYPAFLWTRIQTIGLARLPPMDADVDDRSFRHYTANFFLRQIFHEDLVGITLTPYPISMTIVPGGVSGCLWPQYLRHE